MSKASEWAKGQRMAEENVAPILLLSKYEINQYIVGDLEAEVIRFGGEPAMEIRNGGVRMTMAPFQALALAKWITDTFAEPQVVPPDGTATILRVSHSEPTR